ncbi:CTP synthase [Fusarium acutatum]|uniref:CTP synthase n=1 Tax=Fusarium acutatum TaxID=78861 RepID=A0A8H4NNT8_9HYPO|nr:CTP synthase [Fusarium acutatum]
MKFTTTLLLLIPLAAAGPAISTAEGLPDLATSGEDGYSLSHGEALQLAAKVCPAKFPRKCSIVQDDAIDECQWWMKLSLVGCSVSIRGEH